MTTKTWDGTTNDWFANSGADWSPAGDPAATDNVILNSGEAYLTAGDAGFTVASITLANSGVLAINDPGVTQKVTGAFANSGAFDVDTGSGQGGSTVTIGGALTNSGAIQIGTAVFNLSAPTTATATGLVNTTTGTIDLYGNATAGTTNQATLDITSGAAPATWTGAANLGGDALLEFASGQITGIAAGATLTLSNNVTNAPYQSVPGAPSRVADASNTTTNSALTELASNAGTFELVNGAALAAFELTSNTGFLQIANDPGVADQATTTLTNSGTFVLQDIASFSTLAGVGFTNSGGFDVDCNSGQGVSYTTDGGSTVTIGGALTNSGAIQIGTAVFNLSGPTTVTATGLVNTTTGTIDLYGNATEGTTNQATLDITSGAAPTTWTGAANLGGDALLEFASGQITSIAAGATLTLSNNVTNAPYQSVPGAPSRVADASNTTTNSALTELASNAGTFELVNGAALAAFELTSNTGFLQIANDPGVADQATTTLTNSGTFVLQDIASFSTLAGVGFANSGGFDVDCNSGQGVSYTTDGGSTVTIGGALTNSGAIQIGTAVFNLSGPTTVTATGLVNTTTGTIDLYGNATEGTTNQATLDITSGAAPTTWTGAANLGGDALLEFASGQITSIAAGATLTLSNNVTNAPYQSVPGAPSRVADASNTTTNSALTELASNAGTFELVNGAALAAFELTSNTGFLQIANDPGVADQATTTLTNSGTFVLQDIASFSTLAGVGFTNSGGFDVDCNSGQGVSYTTDGGSTVTIGGALTNSGAIQIGTAVFNLSGPTTVTATGLVNTTTGTIDLYGNATEGTTNQATLDITSGAAPTTWTGAANLGGDALLEFASGQITSIAAGATLTLSNNVTNAPYQSVPGAPSRVADASNTTTNSALTELASNAGTFELVNGAALAAFELTSNTGFLQIANDPGVADQATTTLTNSGTFVLQDIASFSTLAGVGFANSGGFDVDCNSGQGVSYTTDGGSTVTIGGALTNSGAIQIGTAVFNLSGPTTVTATGLVNTTTGTIDLYGNATAGTTNQATLDITSGAAPATWTGAANLGGDALLEFASGQITSIAAGSTLTLSNNVTNAPYQSVPGAPSRVADASNTTTNSALTELASNAGTFELVNGAALAAFELTSNTGFLQIANDPGLADQATTTLTNSGTFVLQDIASFSTLAGVGFANSGGFDVDCNSGQGVSYTTDGGSTVTIGGALTNSGAIQIGTAYFNLSAPTTVTAAALVNESGASLSMYGSASYAATATISGPASNAGTLTIDAYSAFDVTGGNAFTQTGGTTTISADGAFSAATIDIDGGAFVIDTTNFTNSGKLAAADGGQIYLGSGGLTNLSDGTLTGGTYELGAGSTLQLPNNAPIVTDDADIILSGAGSTIEDDNTSTSSFSAIDQTLLTIGAGGQLHLLAGRNWTTPNAAIANDGLIELGGGTLAATGSSASLTDAAGAKLLGYGTVTADSFANSGTIEASSGTLTLTNAIGGTGGLQIDGGADLTLGGAVASGASATFDGAGATLTLDNPASFAASISGFTFQDTIDLVGLTSNYSPAPAGSITAPSEFTLSVSGNVVTQTNSDGSSVVTTFAITGQSYDATVKALDADGNKTSLAYLGVTGAPYDAVTYFFSGTAASGYTKTGWETDYVDQSSGLTKIDFDGSGNLLHEFYTFSGTAPGTLTGVEIDYVAGQEADSLFTTVGPGGASFTTAVYEFDENNNFVGATYQFTGATYDEIQASFTPGTNPLLTETTYSDYTGTGGPNDVSYFDDASGALTGVQETFTGVTGQAYTSDTVLYNASGVAVASEYSGYATKPFASLTYFDNASGGTQEIVRDYTSAAASGSIDGEAYSASETIDNASNALLATAYHLDDGGNVYVGDASNVTSPTFGGSGVTPNAAELSYALPGGDWTITGGGTNDTFTFASLFNTAAITDYGAAFNAGHPDVVSVSTLDFASWSVMLGDAAASGPGGANTTFTSTTTGDKLTLDGVTVAQLQRLTPTQANADFLFHA